MMPKSRGKEKFLFLKQILEDSSSDKESDRKKNAMSERTSKTGESVENQGKESTGPTGKYPVLFKKTCKNKGCQTRLSSFPLFPLPEETEWISDEEAEKKKKATALKKKIKQRRAENARNKNTDVEDYSDRLKSKVKNSDGTRKDFRSEHQLKDTENPVLQGWLHKKAIVLRKQRKLERKERRAKRAALEEEGRIKAEREVESFEKVGEWLRRKRKQARISWRKNRTRVEPQRVDAISNGDSPPQPPPEYRVVRSFQSTEPSPAVEKVLEDYTSKENTVNIANKMNKAPMPSCSESTDKHVLHDNGDTKQQSVKKSSENQTRHDGKIKQRPKTAVDRSENVSHTRPKTAVKRPKTAREKSTVPAIPSSDSPKKMQSLSYDAWLKVKREGDKERTIQKKRELIDSHLEAVIKELGKKRVEKIMSPRKQVDTGLKNSSRPPVSAQPADSKTNKSSPYRWLTSKRPRPEPQGCDYPEVQRTERTVASHSQHAANDSNANATDLAFQSDHDQSTADSLKQPKAPICQEVDAKYNELKPSIEKVKDILDAEIKKLKESGRGSGKELNKPTQQTVELSQPRPKSSRPISARPTTTQAASTARPSSSNLTEEQAKKIAADLDILGLCGSDSEQENGSTGSEDSKVKNDQKSTVRENYFDYGSEVDSPTTTTPEFVQTL